MASTKKKFYIYKSSINGQSSYVLVPIQSKILESSNDHLHQQHQKHLSSRNELSLPLGNSNASLYMPLNGGIHTASRTGAAAATSATNPIVIERLIESDPLSTLPISRRKLVEISRIRNSDNNLVAQNAISHQNLLNVVEDSDESSYGHTISASGTVSSSPSSRPTQHIVNTLPIAIIGSGGCGRRAIDSSGNRAGTREAHNKLEKNRRARLKECYEVLKNQLHLKDVNHKKTSNLAILVAARKHIEALQRKDQELERQVKQLKKYKMNARKKIVRLKRELGPKYEHLFANIITDMELETTENESHSESGSLSSGRGSILYSSSSSLSSSGGNTIPSPLGASMQNAVSGELSPVTSQLSSGVSSSTMIKSSPPSPSASSLSPSCMVSNETSTNVTNSGIPLSLTAKNISATLLTRGSPTPSNPSPSPSSSRVSSSSSIISTSSPMRGNEISLEVSTSVKSECGNSSNNIPNGVKLSNGLCCTTTASVPSTADSASVKIVSYRVSKINKLLTATKGSTLSTSAASFDYHSSSGIRLPIAGKGNTLEGSDCDNHWLHCTEVLCADL